MIRIRKLQLFAALHCAKKPELRDLYLSYCKLQSANNTIHHIIKEQILCDEIWYPPQIVRFSSRYLPDRYEESNEKKKNYSTATS